MRRQKQRKRSHKLCTPSGSTQSSSPSDQSVADRPGHSDNLSRDSIRVPSLHRALRVFPDSLHPQISHALPSPAQDILMQPRVSSYSLQTPMESSHPIPIEDDGQADILVPPTPPISRTSSADSHMPPRVSRYSSCSPVSSLTTSSYHPYT